MTARHIGAAWALGMVTVFALGCGEGKTANGGEGGDDSALGAGGPDAPSGYTVSVRGLAQKGPLSVGAAIEATTLDGSALPHADQKIVTTSSDASGAFDLGTFDHEGPLRLTAEGAYFHEVLGEESLTPVRLHAMVDVVEDGVLNANVNVATHLVEARARALLDGGAEPAEALGQARDELTTALAIGTSDLDLELEVSSIDVMSGTSKADAYGLALSAVVLQASELVATSLTEGTAIVPVLLDDLAADFADGTIDGDRLELLREAETAVLTTRTEDLVYAFSASEVPDLDAVMDTDHDDVVNVDDTCPWVNNPSQEAVLDAVCHAFARPFAIDELDSRVRSLAVGHLDADEHLDAVLLSDDGTLSLAAGGPDGTLAITHQESLPAESVQLADVDSDGTLELLVTGIDVIDVRFLVDGTASFGQSTVSNVPTQGGGGFSVGDMNGDGLPDLVAIASFGNEGSFELPLRLLVSQGQGSFVAAGAHTSLASLDSLAGPLTKSVEDVDGDGLRDVVVVTLDVASDEVVVLVYPGDGTAGLGAPVVTRHHLPVAADPKFPGDAAFGDVDGDGRPDVTLVGRLDVTAVLFGLPDGSFAAPIMSDVGVDLTHARLLATGDFTGDGEADLALAVDPDFVDGIHVVIVPSRGDGTYAEANTRVARLLGPATDAFIAAHADLDDDGADDLVLGLQNGGSFTAGIMRFVP